MHAHVHPYLGNFTLYASLSRYPVLSHTLGISRSYNVAPGEFGSVGNPLLSRYQGPEVDVLYNSESSLGTKRSPWKSGCPRPNP